MSGQPSGADTADHADWLARFNRASRDYRVASCSASLDGEVERRSACQDDQGAIELHALEMLDAFLAQFSAEGAVDHWLSECARGLRPVLVWVPDQDQARFSQAAQAFQGLKAVECAPESARDGSLGLLHLALLVRTQAAPDTATLKSFAETTAKTDNAG